MSRLVVVDGHPVFRKRIVALLRAEGHVVVDHEGSVVRALEVGAAGYVSKQADPTEILAVGTAPGSVDS
jgi:DNA-binding NarL/FixJ family response regulator